jgi:hypothetical protein
MDKNWSVSEGPNFSADALYPNSGINALQRRRARGPSQISSGAERSFRRSPICDAHELAFRQIARRLMVQSVEADSKPQSKKSFAALRVLASSQTFAPGLCPSHRRQRRKADEASAFSSASIDAVTHDDS